MINCPKPKEGKRVSRTTMLLIEPSTEILWNKLQKNEQGIEFPFDFQLIMEDEMQLQEDKIAMTTFANGIRTNQKVQDACRTLINLKIKSKEFMDNKGMNALYLAFGFLNWKENGTKGKELRSPLLLMPVRITYEYDSVSEVGTFQHDSVPPEEVYSVVDADSSQQDAIRLAKRGVSFVL